MNASKIVTRSAAVLFGIALLTSVPVLAADAGDNTAEAEGDQDGPGNAGAEPIPGDAVFKSMHELEGIDRMVDDFVMRVTTDPRIAKRFEKANLERLRLELKQQFCYLTGGPCKYHGKDMKTVHKDMKLQNKDFNALAEDLQLAMDKEGVPFTDQNKLLAKLAPMQRDIVTK